MYQSESMIQMVEALHLQASEMEQHVKEMLEIEGRACGIELDKRRNARSLWVQLNEHKAAQTAETTAMTWAYMPEQIAFEDANVYVTDAQVASVVENTDYNYNTDFVATGFDGMPEPDLEYNPTYNEFDSMPAMSYDIDYAAAVDAGDVDGPVVDGDEAP